MSGDQSKVRVRWQDVAVTAVVAVAAVVVHVQGTEVGARPAGAVGVGLLLAQSLLLLWRRRWPVETFVTGLAVLAVYFGIGYAGGPELPFLMVGLYTMAATGHRVLTAIIALAIAGGGLAYRVGVEAEDAIQVVVSSALLLLVALWGDSVHTRRELRAETSRRLELAAAEQETEARARVAEERLRIARELHDVVAHTITTMTVQAGAARDALAHRPDRVDDLLDGIRAAGRDATTELRAVIRVLRSDDAATLEPAPGLDQLDTVVAMARTAGLDVDLDIAQADVPAAIGLTAHRVVQEAVTNVVRHADASSVAITVSRGPGHLDVVVVDDGRGIGDDEAGYGVRGLIERVEAVGGSLEVAPADPGTRVAAKLPITNDGGVT